jgi:hypothetical protein
VSSDVVRGDLRSSVYPEGTLRSYKTICAANPVSRNRTRRLKLVFFKINRKNTQITIFWNIIPSTFVDRLAGLTTVSEIPASSTVRTTIVHRGGITFIRNFATCLSNCTTVHLHDLIMQKEVLPKHRQIPF